MHFVACQFFDPLCLHPTLCIAHLRIPNIPNREDPRDPALEVRVVPRAGTVLVVGTVAVPVCPSLLLQGVVAVPPAIVVVQPNPLITSWLY